MKFNQKIKQRPEREGEGWPLCFITFHRSSPSNYEIVISKHAFRDTRELLHCKLISNARYRDVRLRVSIPKSRNIKFRCSLPPSLSSFSKFRFRKRETKRELSTVVHRENGKTGRSKGDTMETTSGLLFYKLIGRYVP